MQSDTAGTITTEPDRYRVHPSAVDDLVTADSAGGIAGVNPQASFPDDLGIVVVGVIGDDQHAVVLAQVLDRNPRHLEIVFAPATDDRKVGIVVADLGAFLLQQFDDGQGGRLPQVVDVPLVGH